MKKINIIWIAIVSIVYSIMQGAYAQEEVDEDDMLPLLVVPSIIAAIPRYTLAVTKVGSGTISSSPAGISCGATCSQSYMRGSTVDLTPKPISGWRFSHWSGACNGSGKCTVSMTSNKRVEATFVRITHVLSVSVIGSGTVNSSPPGITCGNDCSEAYVTGTTVSLTPTPASGWKFSKWDGPCSGSGACYVSMTSAKSVKATFYKPYVPPSGVSLLPTYTFKTNSTGLIIVGEIYNNTSSYMRFVKIRANIFNNSSLVATDFTYVNKDIMAPRTKSCFAMWTGYEGTYTDVKFERPDYSTTAERPDNLVISNVSRTTDYFGDLKVLGLVTNKSGQTVDFVKAIGTFYNSSGKAIDCDSSYADPHTLSPNQQSSFQIWTDTPAYSVTNFVLQSSN